MNLEKKNKFLIKKASGEIWCFYIKDKSIYYKENYNNLLEQEIKLIDKIKDYDVSLDSEDNIHLTCITNKEEICYFTYLNNEWRKNIIKNITSKQNSIDCINIIIINTIVHILYSLKNTLNNKLVKIVHLYNNGNTWRQSYSQSVSSMKNKVPYLIDYSINGDIFLIYNIIKNRKYEFYINIYCNNLKKWKIPIKIDLDKENIEIKNFFIDSKNNINIIYNCEDNTEYLFHAIKNSEDLSKSGSLSKKNKWEKNEIAKSEECIEYKIFEIESKLCLIWKVNDYIHYKLYDVYNKDWENDRIVNIQDNYNIYYKGNIYKHKNITKYINTFGTIKDNNVYLAGVDELKTNESHIELEELEINKNNVDKDNIVEENNNKLDYSCNNRKSELLIDESNYYRGNKNNLEYKQEKKLFTKIKNYLKI
ncbi:hypothetical protein [Tepidibacter hydrothermalis]|uniref:SfiI-subtelomeric related protein family member n=1 Tax=Tepidibacter hydrothermalis TaxID=3036126 RepID=A0ABY8EIE0_9FIRM|nr:hypothetical protein [Tepidibacter hydrothermalis]WFD11397.1 hypothetical protein P4S50_04790 [Tepidibacter hydrothermalis]